ncbi:MAG: hypothetical protein KAH84_02745 [Thiomargarita sp.]|nr:hypothetical protein [Thiomargarita sp.]
MPNLPISIEDAAWVEIITPLSTKDLFDFCADIERLYKINPFFEFIKWQLIDNSHFYFEGHNLSNQNKIATKIKVQKIINGFKINYQQGLKTATWIQIKSGSDERAILMIIDDYSGLAKNERQQRLDEVDQSLKVWGQAIYEYINYWQRWSWFPPFRWYMRLWQQMKPMTRRISYMLIVITVFELLLFSVLVVILRILG